MKTPTKCLIAIFLMQVFGLLLVSNAFSNMGHVDKDALKWGMDKYSKDKEAAQSEDRAHFLVATISATHIERDANLIVGVSMFLIFFNSALALWGLIFGRSPDRRAAGDAATIPKPSA